MSFDAVTKAVVAIMLLLLVLPWEPLQHLPQEMPCFGVPGPVAGTVSTRVVFRLLLTIIPFFSSKLRTCLPYTVARCEFINDAPQRAVGVCFSTGHSVALGQQQ